MKDLVIVESPAKAKTIEGYLGKGYKVMSSFGHIRDLPSKQMSIDIENDFKPTYEISPDKKKTVTALKKAAKSAETIWLATDEDREGEAIAWHLVEALGLKKSQTKRIVFHEITKPAILEAVKNPREVDEHLVDAQQARRVLDRLVGYELSPVLWKKVRRGLSAGRVQSVAVRLIVEREREIESFTTESSFKVKAIFLSGKEELEAELDKKFDSKEKARSFLQSLINSDFTIKDVEQKDGKRSPSPPFTTSTMQQEASRKLGYSVRQTMQLAQRLYEAGYITYMRTDSVALSNVALANAGNHIEKNFGKEYLKIRQFKNKNSSAQEAHEAIRPTDFGRLTAGADTQQKKLYSLIFNRALASQMADAKTKKTTVNIDYGKKDSFFVAKGEVVVFDGFLAAYGKDKGDSILPEVKVGDKLSYQTIQALETFSRPPARYSEATLVRQLEEMGIGRPSTYAPTISTIQDRGYVERGVNGGEIRKVEILTLDSGKISESSEEQNTGSTKGKLMPTDIAGIVTDFLVKHFTDVVDCDFTATVEKEFDKISEGKEAWNKMISDFYGAFHVLIKDSDSISRQDAAQARELGKDPKSGRPVFARFGRYGPMIQIGTKDDEEKPKFAPMPEGEKIDTVTLDKAMKMFELPRVVGETEDGQEITANIGRFGPYVKYGSTFVSIKPETPFTISLEKARELIKAKAEKEANKYIQRFEGGIDVVNGRYGPYITDGKTNAKIPKNEDPAKLTVEKAKQLLSDKKSNKKR
jgi:DNA topoisomerase-1